GQSVEQARQTIIQELTNAGKLTKLYEILNKPIICRCGTRVVVHIVDNQWFINYGDPDWKKQAHLCLDQMAILPEERRNEFNYALDWLKERACARKVGLGTRLPWDPDWIIEALSDSVIYMAYYILAKYLAKDWVSFKRFEKSPEDLPDAFFDYIFLGEGSAEAITRENIIPLRQAIAKFGADPLRIGVLSTAELNQDTDFSESIVATIQERLVNLVAQSRKLGRRRVSEKSSSSTLDRWMLSRLNSAAQTAKTAM